MPRELSSKAKEPVELRNKRLQEETQSPDARPKLEEVQEWFRVKDGKIEILEKVYAEIIRRALKVHIADIDHKIKSSLECPIQCPNTRITEYGTQYGGMTPYLPVPVWNPRYARPYPGNVYGRAEEIARRAEDIGDGGATPVRARYDIRPLPAPRFHGGGPTGPDDEKAPDMYEDGDRREYAQAPPQCHAPR